MYRTLYTDYFLIDWHNLCLVQVLKTEFKLLKRKAGNSSHLRCWNNMFLHEMILMMIKILVFFSCIWDIEKYTITFLGHIQLIYANLLSHWLICH